MSNIFASYRSVGFICDNNPINIKKLGSETFITTSIGKTFQVYKADKLRLVMIGKLASSNIRALTSIRDMTYIACNNNILVYKRNEKIHEYLSNNSNNIYILTLLGHLIISIDEKQIMNIWNSRENILYNTLQFDINRRITCVSHPHTYLNKILIGFNDGGMELWNIRTKSCIYKFDTSIWSGDTSLATLLGINNNNNYEKKKLPSITCIQQSPALDIVGIGLQSGSIIIYHLKEAKIIMEFHQQEGAVTSLSFRTDNVEHTFATGTINGTINIWNLENGQLIHSIYDAHESIITTLHFMIQEPILISSGNDNSLKQWIFDKSDHSARLLKQRVGHSEPPRHIQFYTTVENETASINKCTILSAGNDRSFRMFSVLRDQHSHEFSQGKNKTKKARNRHISEIELKLPPIIKFDTCEIRRRDWSNIITAHYNRRTAYLWSFQNRTISKTKLRQKNRKLGEVSAVCISSCGNFGIIGYSDGEVCIYNLQSGHLRYTLNCTNDEIQECLKLNNNNNNQKLKHRKRKRDNIKSAHDNRVEGVVVDALNQQLITASLDKTIRFWSFSTRELQHIIKLDVEISSINLHKDSGLLAVATDDWQIIIYDISTHRAVRHFRGHQHSITDMTFSPDCRWLVTSCMDGSMRVFDIPSGQLVDWIIFDKPITSLTFSPLGDFLATSHANSLGIFLWANRSYFSSVYLRSAPNEPVHMELRETQDLNSSQITLSSSLPQVIEDNHINNNNKNNDLFNSITFAPQPLPITTSQPLLSLSGLPTSKWKNLAMLDVIKERNKPTEPVEQPPDAPFFLPTTSEVDTQLIISDEKNKNNETLNNIETNIDYTSRILSTKMTRNLTPLVKLLQVKAINYNEDEKIMIYLKSLSPSAIDSEIRSLGNDPLYEIEEIGMFIDYLIAQFMRKLNFEFLNSLLHLLLQAHNDIIADHSELRIKLPTLLKCQETSWNRLDELLQSNLSLISHFTQTQI